MKYWRMMVAAPATTGHAMDVPPIVDMAHLSMVPVNRPWKWADSRRPAGRGTGAPAGLAASSGSAAPVAVRGTHTRARRAHSALICWPAPQQR